jgi:hypothetical protein
MVCRQNIAEQGVGCRFRELKSEGRDELDFDQRFRAHILNSGLRDFLSKGCPSQFGLWMAVEKGQVSGSAGL